MTLTDLDPSRRSMPRMEALLVGFKPSVEFERVDPLPEGEFEDRLRRIRREAVGAGYDAILVHSDGIGSLACLGALGRGARLRLRLVGGVYGYLAVKGPDGITEPADRS